MTPQATAPTSATPVQMTMLRVRDFVSTAAPPLWACPASTRMPAQVTNETFATLRHEHHPGRGTHAVHPRSARRAARGPAACAERPGEEAEPTSRLAGAPQPSRAAHAGALLLRHGGPLREREHRERPR